MPKINQEEYEVLKSLDDGWKWIARDKNEKLYKFQEEPKIVNDFKWDDRKRTWLGMSRDRFQFIQWEDEEPYHIQELIDEYESSLIKCTPWTPNPLDFNESEETEVKKDIEWLKKEIGAEMIQLEPNRKVRWSDVKYQTLRDVAQKINQLDKPEPKNISLQDVTHRLWELPLNDRKYWLEHLNDEFQEGYIVPLGLKTTDGEKQYLTLNGSYFASRRNRHLQQTFATLEEIPEFYRDLAERVL